MMLLPLFPHNLIIFTPSWRKIAFITDAILENKGVALDIYAMKQHQEQ